MFVNIYNDLENKKFLPEKVPLNTPFAEKKQDIRTILYIYIVLAGLLRYHKLILPTLLS